MNDYATERQDVIDRARRRFPDHRVDIAFPVCLPVYDLRLRVTEIAEHDLTAPARFVLQLVELGVTQPAETGRMLGLSDGYVAEAAAELLSDRLVVQNINTGLSITENGKKTLSAGGRSLRPRNRHLNVAYDPMSKRVADIDVGQLLDRNVVRKGGLFIVPAKPRPPRLSAIRIDEVRDYDAPWRGPRRSADAQLLEVADIKDSKLRYRDDVMLVKLDAPNSNKPVFAAYRAMQYLESESASIQRLADKGVDIVPDEFNAGQLSPPMSSVSASQEEAALVADISRIHSEVADKDEAAAVVKAAQGDTQSAAERAELGARVKELEAEKMELQNLLAERESELKEATEGKTQIIVTEEHRHFLLKAIDEASSELILVSAWIDPYAFDDEVCRRLAAAIGRGATVKIAWGLGAQKRRGPDGLRNRNKGNGALANLKKLIPRDIRNRLTDKLTETHEKFIICDDSFCAWGSFNWLSYRGERDSGYRRETSFYSERPEDIALWKRNAGMLFGS